AGQGRRGPGVRAPAHGGQAGLPLAPRHVRRRRRRRGRELRRRGPAGGRGGTGRQRPAPARIPFLLPLRRRRGPQLVVGGLRGALRAAGPAAGRGGRVVRLPARAGAAAAPRRVGVGAGRARRLAAAGGAPARGVTGRDGVPVGSRSDRVRTERPVVVRAGGRTPGG